jgi:hypothetical protein
VHRRNEQLFIPLRIMTLAWRTALKGSPFDRDIWFLAVVFFVQADASPSGVRRCVV